MQVLDLRCPHAFDQLDAVTNADNSNSIEINVDKIVFKTFVELDSYVKQKLLEKTTTHEGPGDTQVVEKKSKNTKSSNGRKSA